MKRAILGALVLSVLCGCGESSYLPPTSHALDESRLQGLISVTAARYKVPQGLVRAIVMAESAGDPRAMSGAGAQGLMQLMPGTAQSCGIDNPFDPFENVDCGTRYLRGLLRRYHNNVRLALAAYNAGPGAVNKYGGVPPYLETQAYVTRVLATYRERL